MESTSSYTTQDINYNDIEALLLSASSETDTKDISLQNSSVLDFGNIDNVLENLLYDTNYLNASSPMSSAESESSVDSAIESLASDDNHKCLKSSSYDLDMTDMNFWDDQLASDLFPQLSAV